MTVRAAVATPESADFAWPEFDHWQAVFAADGAFPPRWEGLHGAPPSRTAEAGAYQYRKFLLFVEWLDMLGERPAVLARYARQGITPRVVRQATSPRCPACDPFHARELAGGPDAMPPFHPGCRCVLVATRPAPARPRSGALQRSRRRTA